MKKQRTRLAAAACAILLVSLFAAQETNPQSRETFRVMLDRMSVKQAPQLFAIMADVPPEFRCSTVTHWMVRGVDAQGMTVVALRCANTREYTVLVPANIQERTTIADCAKMRQVSGLKCWGPL